MKTKSSFREFGNLHISFLGGNTNYTFIINGTINQAAWDALPNSLITVRFYANDTLGNISFVDVIIYKEVSDGGKKIPGYNLLFFIGSLLVFIAIAYIYIC